MDCNIVDFRHYARIKHVTPIATHTLPGSSGVSGGGGIPYTTLNADYACYLIKTRDITLPVWTAALGTKGQIAAGRMVLNTKMARTLAKELKKEGYWMH